MAAGAKNKKDSKLIIEMTQKQAEAIGIVFCSCGHPPNNHFSHDKKPCAHCPCKEYDQHISLPDGKGGRCRAMSR